MKLHLLEFSENGKRLLQLRWIWLLFRFTRSGSFNGGNPSCDTLLFLGLLRFLTWLLCRSSALCHVAGLVMLLLNDFLGVRDVSWVSHRSNIKPRKNAARSDFLPNRQRWHENRAVRSDVCLAKLFRRLRARLSLHR